MNEAVKLLHRLPSSWLIKQTHKILLQVYVANTNYLENIELQNWIGGASISDATFIPPIHLVLMSSFRILKYLQTMKYHHCLI
jgi:hypothetical protein